MYPIRKTRPFWTYPFLQHHLCNELCNAQYEIQDNVIRITYQTGCLFPEKVEPIYVHISDHSKDYYINSLLEHIPKTIHFLLDFPLKNPRKKTVIFTEEELTLSMVLKIFDDFYKETYEEEELHATIQDFTIKKSCMDCDDDKYSEQYIDSFLHSINDQNDDNQCNICFEGGNELIEIKLCKHQYHKNCILKWFNTTQTSETEEEHKSNSCPLCRQPIIYCNTCRGTREIQQIYRGSVIPYSSDHTEERVQTDGPYMIHTLYYEELLFKGVLYDKIQNTIRLLPYERIDSLV